MTNDLITFTSGAIAEYSAPSQNPARVYLAGLSAGSQGAMTAALNIVAGLIADGATLDTIPWGALRYEHTQAIRARLADSHGYSYANKILSALAARSKPRGVSGR